MRVWTTTDFKGVWPTPTAAVVVAEDERQAEQLLRAIIPRPSEPFSIQELDLRTPSAVVLADGDY